MENVPVRLWGGHSNSKSRPLEILGAKTLLNKIEGHDYSKVDWPLEGEIREVGPKTYLFKAGETGVWVLPGGDMEGVSGTSCVASICTGGYGNTGDMTILLLGEVAFVKEYGYKRRAHTTTLYQKGIAQKLSEGQLYALGLIEYEPKSEIKPPEPFNPTLREKLRELGLDKF